MSFPLQISGVRNSPPIRLSDPMIQGDGYWINNTSYSLKMVSLRAVCYSLGYQVNWTDNKVITVTRTGDITVSFRIDENTYMSSYPDAPPDKMQSRSLESAPTMIKGVTYVPISFFDQILELVAYHVYENDNIIFTTYWEH